MINRKEINRTVCGILRLINIYLQNINCKKLIFLENKENIMLALEDDISVNYNLKNGIIEFLDLKKGKLITNPLMCNIEFREDQFRKHIIKLFSKRVKGGFDYYKEIHEDKVKFNPDIKYLDVLEEDEVERLLTLTEEGLQISFTAVDIKNKNSTGWMVRNDLLYSVNSIGNRFYSGSYVHFFNRGFSNITTFSPSDYEFEWLERLFSKYYIHAEMKDLWNSFQLIKSFLEKERWIKGLMYFRQYNIKDIESRKDKLDKHEITFLNHVMDRMPLNKSITNLDPISVCFSVLKHERIYW